MAECAYDDEVYYRCTACFECFFTPENFFRHAQAVHCKVLKCQGHNPGNRDSEKNMIEQISSVTPQQQSRELVSTGQFVQVKEEISVENSCEQNTVVGMCSQETAPLGSQHTTSSFPNDELATAAIEQSASGIFKAETHPNSCNSIPIEDNFIYSNDYGLSHSPSNLIPEGQSTPAHIALTFPQSKQIVTSNKRKNRTSAKNMQPAGENSASRSSIGQSALGYSEGSKTVVKQWKCPTCNAAFLKRNYLQGHMRKHADKVLHCCGICSYSTRYLQYFKRHMSTHTGEKPFKCSICSYASARAYSLKLHIRRHTGERPFKCEECGAAFTTRNEVKNHQRIHVGDKVYNCEACPARFSQFSGYVSHQLVHTDGISTAGETSMS